MFVTLQIKNRVPATLNQEGWENQTINTLQEQLNQVTDILKLTLFEDRKFALLAGS